MKRAALAIGLIAALNGFILGVAKLASGSVIDAWKKGPLIDPIAPYAPENAQWYFSIGMCATLNLYLLLLFVFRKTNHRKILPVLCFILAIGTTEMGLQGYLSFNQKSYFRPHPTLHWVVRSNLKDFPNKTGGGLLNTNSDGMRAAQNWQPKKDTFRILVLGDSSNFGHGVSDSEMWSSQLEKKLQAHTTNKLEVINGACPGWTTYQGLEALKTRYAKYKPDLVLVGFNNDSGPDFMPDQQRSSNSSLNRTLNHFLYRLELYLLGREAVLSILRRMSPTAQKAYKIRLAGEKSTYGALPESESLKLVPRVSLSAFEDNLNGFQQWAHTHGADFIWVNMPINRREPELVNRYVDYSYRALVQELSDSNHLNVIDVDDYWLRTREPNLHIPAHLFHPNKRGHNRMAEQIADALLQQALIPQTDTTSLKIGGPRPATTSKTLRLGYSTNSPIHAHVGAILTKHPELATDLGLDVELYPFKSGKEQGEALARHELDAWFSCALPAIRMLDSRPDSRILKSLGIMGNISVVAPKDIQTMAQLAGKRIGLSKGSTPEMDWKNWSKDIPNTTTINLKTDVLDEALKNGQIDALVSWDPWVNGWLNDNPNWHILESRPFYSVLIGTHLWSITSDQTSPRAARLVTLVENALDLASKQRETLDKQISLETGWPLTVISDVSNTNACLRGDKCELFMDDSVIQPIQSALRFAHPEEKSIDRLYGEGLLKGKAFAPPPP